MDKTKYNCVKTKKRQQAQNGVTCAKPTLANQHLIPNLIPVSASPRMVTYKQSILNYLVSTNEVIPT